jgi:hypothetical protein
MKKLAHKTEIIEWYARWIIDSCDTPIDEIEWLVSHLSDNTFSEITEMYYDYSKK